MTRTEDVRIVFANELERLRPQLDTVKGLISMEMRISFDVKTGVASKIQLSLHTARLTPARQSG